jgi:hypothetical protein
MHYTRRDLGKIALAALPAIRASGAVNSKIGGVQIGAITYSFRSMPDLDTIIQAMAGIALGEAELISNHAEAAAGAPSQGRGPGGGPGAGPPGGGCFHPAPEQQAALRARAEDLKKWRLSVSLDKFQAVRKKFDDAGIDLALLCFNMNESITGGEIDYGFQMAKVWA